MQNSRASLIIVALSLVALPFALDLVGLPLRSSIDVVAFADCVHGPQYSRRQYRPRFIRTWRLVRARRLCRGSEPALLVSGIIILPALFAIVFVAVSAVLSGALILRRRGVYFSLLTLALTALLFAIGFRWTEFTGGESGLGGVTRATVLGVDLERDGNYYLVVAAVAMGDLCPALALSSITGWQRTCGDP